MDTFNGVPVSEFCQSCRVAIARIREGAVESVALCPTCSLKIIRSRSPDAIRPGETLLSAELFKVDRPQRDDEARFRGLPGTEGPVTAALARLLGRRLFEELMGAGPKPRPAGVEHPPGSWHVHGQVRANDTTIRTEVHTLFPVTMNEMAAAVRAWPEVFQLLDRLTLLLDVHDGGNAEAYDAIAKCVQRGREICDWVKEQR